MKLTKQQQRWLALRRITYTVACRTCTWVATWVAIEQILFYLVWLSRASLWVGLLTWNSETRSHICHMHVDIGQEEVPLRFVLCGSRATCCDGRRATRAVELSAAVAWRRASPYGQSITSTSAVDGNMRYDARWSVCMQSLLRTVQSVPWTLRPDQLAATR